mmetsp:Transcript_28766/g.61313  ORF Transcript_28766/g.61313 Transcript_28766/m.61313 type:complete len:278 (+) Transcript_28766:36-869(+)
MQCANLPTRNAEAKTSNKLQLKTGTASHGEAFDRMLENNGVVCDRLTVPLLVRPSFRCGRKSSPRTSDTSSSCETEDAASCASSTEGPGDPRFGMAPAANKARATCVCPAVVATSNGVRKSADALLGSAFASSSVSTRSSRPSRAATLSNVVPEKGSCPLGDTSPASNKGKTFPASPRDTSAYPKAPLIASSSSNPEVIASRTTLIPLASSTRQSAPPAIRSCTTACCPESMACSSGICVSALATLSGSALPSKRWLTTSGPARTAIAACNAVRQSR